MPGTGDAIAAAERSACSIRAQAPGPPPPRELVDPRDTELVTKFRPWNVETGERPVEVNDRGAAKHRARHRAPARSPCRPCGSSRGRPGAASVPNRLELLAERAAHRACRACSSPAAAKKFDVVKNRPALISVTFGTPSADSLMSTQYDAARRGSSARIARMRELVDGRARAPCARPTASRSGRSA